MAKIALSRWRCWDPNLGAHADCPPPHILGNPTVTLRTPELETIASVIPDLIRSRRLKTKQLDLPFLITKVTQQSHLPKPSCLQGSSRSHGPKVTHDTPSNLLA